jgi:hypothetical protein
MRSRYPFGSALAGAPAGRKAGGQQITAGWRFPVEHFTGTENTRQFLQHQPVVQFVEHDAASRTDGFGKRERTRYEFALAVEAAARYVANVETVILPGGYDTRVLGIDGMDGVLFGIEFKPFELDPRIAKLVPGDLAIRHQVLPLKRDGRTLTVALADPTNLGVLEDLKFITRYDIFPVLAGEYTLRNLIEKYYEASDQELQSILKDMEETAEDVRTPAIESQFVRPAAAAPLVAHEGCAEPGGLGGPVFRAGLPPRPSARAGVGRGRRDWSSRAGRR